MVKQYSRFGHLSTIHLWICGFSCFGGQNWDNFKGFWGHYWGVIYVLLVKILWEFQISEWILYGLKFSIPMSNSKGYVCLNHNLIKTVLHILSIYSFILGQFQNPSDQKLWKTVLNSFIRQNFKILKFERVTWVRGSCRKVTKTTVISLEIYMHVGAYLFIVYEMIQIWIFVS